MNVQNLFQAVGNMPKQTVAKGSIITFSYIGQQRNYRIHDPTPLALVAGIYNDNIAAINLHYLTLPYIKNLVTNYANNPNFSFKFIGSDSYIVGAFRTYKRSGISQLKMLDTNFLKNLLSVVRALDPGEIEKMRDQVRMMIEQQSQQPAAVPGLEQR
jgi:hypothetical protein